MSEEERRTLRERLKSVADEKPRPVKKASPVAEAEQPSFGAKREGYKPSWWVGEQVAYKNAKVAMKGISGLPKMKKGGTSA